MQVMRLMKGKGKEREEDGRSLSSLRSRSSNPLPTGTTFVDHFVDYVMMMRTMLDGRSFSLKNAFRGEGVHLSNQQL